MQENKLNVKNTLDQYIGALMGCAIGDTFGMPVENWKREQIQKHVGRVTELLEPVLVKDDAGNILSHDELGKLGYISIRQFKKGDYTDDTILTLALAESIVAKKDLDLNDVAARQLHEYVIRLKPSGKALGGFGGTTITAFKNLQNGIPPLESGVIGSPGNAPCMKMHPVGLYMHATKKNRNGIEFAEAVGKITHLDSRSVVSGVVQAQAVYSLLAGANKDEFLETIERICYFYERPVQKEFTLAEAGTLAERLKWVKENRNANDEEAYKKLGCSGLVFESHPFALFMFQKYWDTPFDGLVELVNFGGDCDTTGAIYGALAGALHGPFWPKEWHVNGEERIINAAKSLYSLKD